jgi:hypothetical protein
VALGASVWFEGLDGRFSNLSTSPLPEVGSPPPPTTRRIWPRRALAILVTALVVGLVLLGALALGLREPQNDLIAAKRLMVEGRRALTFGNVDDARERFRKAGEHFAAAEDEAISGIAGIVGRVPVVGATSTSRATWRRPGAGSPMPG